MREEHKLNKAIKKDGVDTQSEILEELKRRYPQYVRQPENKQAPVRKKRAAVISVLAAVAVCVAIIVPCSVLLPNRNNGDNDNILYRTQAEYNKNYVEFTIGEYRETHNRNFLYFDWYDVGEDFDTVCYIANSNQDVLCLGEQAYLPDNGEFIHFSITKSNVFLDVFSLTIASCTKEQTIDYHMVKWLVNDEAAICFFEDNGYRYFIQILQGQDENRLFELVAELLETK